MVMKNTVRGIGKKSRKYKRVLKGDGRKLKKS